MALPTYQELLQAMQAGTPNPGAALESRNAGFGEGAKLAALLEQKRTLTAQKAQAFAEKVRTDETLMREREAATKAREEAGQAHDIYGADPKTGVFGKIGTLPPGGKMAPPNMGVQSYATVRGKQFVESDLPSNQSATSPSGAASQIQLAVRQGKALIAHPGSPQQLALASSDLARAVQRSAPQLETLRGGGFAQNLLTQIGLLTQKVTADPSSPDVPKLRKQIYDVLDDLEKSSKPLIQRQLDTVEDIYKDNLPQNWEKIKKAQLGENFPEIPFIESVAPAAPEKPAGNTAEAFKAKYGIK